MKDVISIILLPVLSGILLFLIPEKFRTLKGVFALIISTISGYLSVLIFIAGDQILLLNNLSLTSGLSVSGFDLLRDAGRYLTFNCDNLSRLIILFVSLFSS